MSKQKFSTSTATKITVGQKVMVGVALLAGFGAVAAGFASIPGEKGRSGKGYATAQPYTAQPTYKTQPYKTQLMKTSPFKTQPYKTQPFKTQPIKTLIYKTTPYKTLINPIPQIPLKAGMVVKQASATDIYYVGSDSRLHLFPFGDVYASWKTTLPNGFVTIPDAQFNNTPKGANVHIRPGFKILKTATGTSLYTTTKGGILHRLASEKVAAQYFGAAWNSKVIVVPSGNTGDYHLGEAATENTPQFSPFVVFDATPTIDADLSK